MDQRFQASFIPKASLDGGSQVVKKPINYFMVGSVLLFSLSVATAGFGYFYVKSLDNKIVEKKDELATLQKKLPVDTIKQLVRTDQRIENAKKILQTHIAVSNIFTLLENFTSKNVRFTDMEFRSDKGITLKLKGQAKSYNSVSFQSDVMRSSKYFISPIFSDLAISDKSTLAQFSIDTGVDPAYILYKNNFISTKQ